MSYRNIEVLGETYRYIVGKSHLKISGLGSWPKSEVGERHSEDLYVVTPAHVRNKILECRVEERTRGV